MCVCLRIGDIPSVKATCYVNVNVINEALLPSCRSEEKHCLEIKNFDAKLKLEVKLEKHAPKYNLQSGPCDIAFPEISVLVRTVPLF